MNINNKVSVAFGIVNHNCNQNSENVLVKKNNSLINLKFLNEDIKDKKAILCNIIKRKK